ncbi:MAG TPA: SCO family protein [Polyangia bacterium]|nr:SCO family protein [Polyangia bacterium]
MTARAPRPPITARLIQNPFVWAAVMGVLFGVPIYRSMTRRLTASPAVLGGLRPFTLTDQTGRPFGSRELAGKIWVADFIFTACQQACPLLSERMAEVGKRARHLGPDFHLVSISVDPERDTPERLAAYAARYGANPIAWSFLTGPEQAIQATVVEGFKVGAGKERSGGADGGPGFWEIFHGEKLVLVDRQMRIRGYFDATPEGIDKLMEAVGRVANGA